MQRNAEVELFYEAVNNQKKHPIIRSYFNNYL